MGKSGVSHARGVVDVLGVLLLDLLPDIDGKKTVRHATFMFARLLNPDACAKSAELVGMTEVAAVAAL